MYINFYIIRNKVQNPKTSCTLNRNNIFTRNIKVISDIKMVTCPCTTYTMTEENKIPL